MRFLRKRTFWPLLICTLAGGAPCPARTGAAPTDALSIEHERALAPFSSTSSARIGSAPVRIVVTGTLPTTPVIAEPGTHAATSGWASLSLESLRTRVPHLAATGFTPPADSPSIRDDDLAWAMRDDTPAQSLTVDGRDPARERETAELAADALPATRRHPVVERLAAIPEPGSAVALLALGGLLLALKRGSVKDS